MKNFNTIITAIVFAGVIVLAVCIVRYFRRLLRALEVRKEKSITMKSLGEAIKTHRTECKMTQEFVAEAIGVSRQAVSKWESGTTDPSTSNLIALAKLFHISPEEFLGEIDKQ